ncbi:MAG: thiol protease/hemagglutinin PrtT [Muribaculaceae bacterium]|nr:thiol protease/hemagglutinin PrtT [Muribaculaceae bacterium]
MKRLNLSSILLLALAVPGTAHSEVLTPEAALNRAAGLTRSATSEYTLAKTFNTVAGTPAMYLFHDNAGALVVSADDAAQPLLAILDNEFDGTETNPAFDYWMAEYARQIEWIRANPSKGAGPAKQTRSRIDIAPLLATSWDQGAPYNDLVPAKDGETCFTGCVATALTQVMNYHKWPEKGTGSNSYTSGTNKFELNCNFDDVVFDWKNMANSYWDDTTEEQNHAVADLMYTVGIALNMDYGVGSQGGSGAYTENVPYALVKYFNYDKGAHVVYRDAMPYAEWEQLVYDQLSLGPVYYAGSSDDGAHAYVCDGYRDGYFHINWGWGGSQNGYYLLTAMFPGSQQGAGGSTGSYDFEQMIVADIKKPQPNSEIEPLMIYSWGNWLFDNDEVVKTVTVGRDNEVGIAGWAQNRSIEPLSLTAGLQLESESGEVTVLDAGHYDLERYNPYFNNQDCYVYWLATTVPSTVKNGKYIARPVYMIDGTSDWKPMQVLKAYHQAYLLEVTEDSITMSNAEQADVNIEKMEFTSRTVAGKSLQMAGVMTNTSDYDYESCIRLYVYDADYNEMAQGGRRFLTVPAGETVDFTYESNLMGTLQPGEYSVWFADAFTGEWLGEGIAMNYEKAPAAPTLSAESFTFDGDPANADNMNLDFTLVIKCKRGWFRDRMDVTIWTSPEDGSAGYYVTTATSDEFELYNGDTAEVKFHGSIEDPIIGMRYIAGAWYGGKQYGNAVTFKISAAGVDEIEAVEAVNTEIYTLTGVKVNVSKINNLPSGIYVIKTTDANGKTTVRKQMVK